MEELKPIKLTMNAEDFALLMERLEEEPQINPGLEKLFSNRAPWLRKSQDTPEDE